MRRARRLPFRAPVRRVTLPLAGRAERAPVFAGAGPHSTGDVKRARTTCYGTVRWSRPTRGLGERADAAPGTWCVWYLFYPGKPRQADRRQGPRGKRSEVTRFGQNTPGRCTDSAGYGRRKRARGRSERAPVDLPRTVRTVPEQARSDPWSSEADILPMLSPPRATDPVETSGVSGRANPPSPGTPGFLSTGFLLLSRRQAKQNVRRRCFYRARSRSTPLTFRT